eukprot:CAMPEP_0179845386 /NCGR_PEP_ID=MMETSP0982-20121206/4943_1 /TAXON_ID=483367 /ORGANISM="non described non described, Strain CCMP 2436" /LENGTH=30 /DNA_ID= /DNA_START= /DNA_END= /DNA_ORIENTATION=
MLTAERVRPEVAVSVAAKEGVTVPALAASE